MRVLLLGAGGMLGRALAAAAPPPPDVAVMPLTRASLDITDALAVRAAIAATRPDCIVNAAAYTAVDQAESESEVAHAVNGRAVGQLGALAREAGARVVHFSTDYVFDGAGGAPYREDAPTHPLNAYGASKRAGEEALAACVAPSLVIRSQWLFGDATCFCATMLARARAGAPTRVVNDQRGRPTYAVDLAGAAWKLISLGLEGTIHVTNDGDATWYDVARAIFEHEGVPSLLAPCSSAEYASVARRPRDSRLDTTRAEQLLCGPLPDWRDALRRFLARPGRD